MAERGDARQPRRGPAPIASFDHDVSDESSPETKQAIRLPEIREDQSSAAARGEGLLPPEQRARSHSTPGALQAPPAPRIDISRASSSSHQDSRDSSPELALFAGGAPGAGAGELGFREDGALDLRSSTEELAFLEPAPGERPAPPAPRRHSRKDSQGSEAALLAVSGRTSRLSSVGSQCSAHSALSAFSRGREPRLSVASGASRSPSPHRMLLETSFCGPKPIETDPEICAAAVEERLLEMVKLNVAPPPAPAVAPPPGWVVPAPTAGGADAPAPGWVVPAASAAAVGPVDARDRREVRTEATVERATPRPPVARQTPAPVQAAAVEPASVVAREKSDPVQPVPDQEKRQKETRNRARAEERQARSRERRDPTEQRAKSATKDIIRIRLKPSEEYDDDDDASDPEPAAGPAPRAVAARPTELAAEPAPARRPPRDSRTPSPAGAAASRKSSFCSLFKSRETIASPESPSDALRRKKSLNDGRSRSRSRDRSTTPTSATKIRGSVLSLFRTPRKSATSPSPSSREGSPVVTQVRQVAAPPDRPRRAGAVTGSGGERLKYYEDTKEGIIHIPLRTPPDEAGPPRAEPEPRPASAPQPRAAPAPAPTPLPPVFTAAPTTRSTSPAVSAASDRSKPIQRTVLPDGSIIIPLHSPTERAPPEEAPPPPVARSPEASRSTDDGPRPGSSVATVTSSERATSSDSSPNAVRSSGAPTPTAAAPTPASTAAPDASDADRARRRERLVFMTHVGSRDQVFSTQFSITKTPSVASEISGSFPSFPDAEAPRESGGATTPASAEAQAEAEAASSPWAGTPRAGPSPSPVGQEARESRDSSGSEASSEAAPARAGNDVEQRGLVVQESFEEELPYVPTTLPQERSLALPMVPVRERPARVAVAVAPVERPRPPSARHHRPSLPGIPAPQAAAVPIPTPTPPAATGGAEGDKLRIKLPRRPRTGSAGTGLAGTGPTGTGSSSTRPDRARTRTGSEGVVEPRPKTEWIDFSEVPERRKQPTRIQTLPAARDVVFNYVPPEECRCECHARDPAPPAPECSEHGSGS